MLSQFGIGEGMDLGSWVSRRSVSGPSRRALTFEGQTMTYGDLDGRIDQLAAELRAGGVRSGGRVGYLGPNHPAFLIALFACARLGAIFVPLNYRLTGSEIAYIVDDAELHTLIADVDAAAVVDTVRSELSLARAISLKPVAGWESWDDVVAQRRSTTVPRAQATPSDVAIIMYTSGTTGSPKGAMLTHGNLFWNNVNALFSFDVASTDTTYVVAPLFHIGGLNVTTLLTLQKGGHVVLAPSFDAAGALEDIVRYRVTTMFGVPAMFLAISQLPEFETVDLAGLSYVICGGAPVPEPLIERYAERGIAFAQGYGLTETAPLALVMGIDQTATRIGAAGHKVLPLSDVRLVDSDNVPVAPGTPGEICVRGPQVMVGYWQNPRATAAAIDAQKWFHTGDIGREDPDGYIYVIDRLKDMVITGGENVYPAEVESVLYSHPAVTEVAVVGTPDPKWGEAVTAVVATAPGRTVTLEELRAHAAVRLARFKLPLRLEIVDQLPRTMSGKVLKTALRDQFSVGIE